MRKRIINLKRTNKNLKTLKNKQEMHLNNIEANLVELKTFEPLYLEDPEFLDTWKTKIKEINNEKFNASVNSALIKQINEQKFARYVRKNPEIIKRKLKNINEKITKTKKMLVTLKGKNIKHRKEIETKLKNELKKLLLEKNTLAKYTKLNIKEISELGKLK